MSNSIKKILVTGGAGYIGSHTVVALSKAGFLPIIIDDFRNSSVNVIDNINSLCHIQPIYYNFDCGDATKLSQVFQEHILEGVIHFAAYKAVGESVDYPEKYFENNIGTLTLLVQKMKEYNVRNIVFSSSCTVYGEPDTTIVSETDPMKMATSAYGYSKQVCENLLQFINKSKLRTIHSTILRYFNPIGAHPSGLIGELPLGTPNNLVPYITQSAAGILGQLTVFGDTYKTPDGTCIRDFIHVMDLADAHVAALTSLINSDSTLNIYNIGTGKGTSVMELINSFEKVTNVKLNYKIGLRREGDIEKIYANADKAYKELNWKSKYSIDEALADSWRWQQTCMKLSVK